MNSTTTTAVWWRDTAKVTVNTPPVAEDEADRALVAALSDYGCDSQPDDVARQLARVLSTATPSAYEEVTLVLHAGTKEVRFVANARMDTAGYRLELTCNLPGGATAFVRVGPGDFIETLAAGTAVLTTRFDQYRVERLKGSYRDAVEEGRLNRHESGVRWPATASLSDGTSAELELVRSVKAD